MKVIKLSDELTPRDIVRPEELCQLNISMTQSGIEPSTSRLVAQCPLYSYVSNTIFKEMH